MAPFHHHLQEKGIAENRVVQIYVAVSVAVSLLLPFLWLWNSWALPSEPAWLAVLLAAALAAGIVRCRVTAEAGFTGSISTILGASGFAAGAAVYWAFSVWLPEPLTAALLTALLLRAIWVVRA